LVLYQTLDNLDGRQARRTESSSPLGLLFDHGVDAVNSSLACLMTSAVYELGPTWKVLATYGATYWVFVFATWEEYYTGKLTLGVVNGPTDGVLLASVFCLMSAYYPGLWAMRIRDVFPNASLIQQYPWLGEEQMHLIIIVVAWCGVIPTLIWNGKAIAGKGKSVASAIVTIVPFIVEAILALVWVFYSPTNIYAKHTRLFLWSVGFLFCNMICKLMLAHLTNQPYKIMRLVLLPLALAVLLTVAMPLQTGSPPVLSEESALYVSCLFHVGFWLHLVCGVINELTTVLQIRCFRIPLIKKEKTVKY